jgi:hypothetical protein
MPKPSANKQCSFNIDWTSEKLYPEVALWIEAVPGDNSAARCKFCSTKISVSNMGISALRSHASGAKHRKRDGSALIVDFFSSENQNSSHEKHAGTGKDKVSEQPHYCSAMGEKPGCSSGSGVGEKPECSSGSVVIGEKPERSSGSVVVGEKPVCSSSTSVVGEKPESFSGIGVEVKKPESGSSTVGKPHLCGEKLGLSSAKPVGLLKYKLQDETTTAEVLWCIHTVMTHGSDSASGKAVSLFKRMFPQSPVA